MKTWYVCTVEFYSFVKKNEIKIADKWVYIKNIILSKVTQTWKEENHIFTFICSFLIPYLQCRHRNQDNINKW